MTTHGDDHRIGINPYLDWARAEGIPISYGVSLNLFEIELGDWPRYGVAGGIAHYPGSGDYCNQFVMAIPPGGSTTPQRHLYEEIYFVLDGRGSTQVEFADGQRRSFEWGPRSAFAVPLNAKYRHFNASGTQRALLVTTTTLPILMQLFRDSDFIFNTDHYFTNRIGRDEYYSGEGDLTLVRPGNNVWETNFVPDMNAIELTPWDDRGQGSGNIMFTLANSGMHLHVSEIAPATYKKAHRHPAGAHVLTLTGSGYSLLWSEGDADFQRVDLGIRRRFSTDRGSIPPAFCNEQQSVALPRHDDRRSPLSVPRRAAETHAWITRPEASRLAKRQRGRQSDRV